MSEKPIWSKIRQKADMIPEVNNQQMSVGSFNRTGLGSTLSPSVGGFRRHSLLIKVLSSKEHLDWLKIDLNAVKIIAVQENKYRQN